MVPLLLCRNQQWWVQPVIISLRNRVIFFKKSLWINLMKILVNFQTLCPILRLNRLSTHYRCNLKILYVKFTNCLIILNLKLRPWNINKIKITYLSSFAKDVKNSMSKNKEHVIGETKTNILHTIDHIRLASPKFKVHAMIVSSYVMMKLSSIDLKISQLPH